MKTIEVKNLQRDVDPFTLAYIECALWSTMDNANDQGGEPLDANYNWTHLSDDTLLAMTHDCRRFQELNRIYLQGYPTKDAGHDFWLTRNGHGAGFWENDHGSETQCEALTNSSHEFGEFNLYVGDDGKIYH